METFHAYAVCPSVACEHGRTVTVEPSDGTGPCPAGLYNRRGPVLQCLTHNSSIVIPLARGDDCQNKCSISRRSAVSRIKRQLECQSVTPNLSPDGWLLKQLVSDCCLLRSSCSFSDWPKCVRCAFFCGVAAWKKGFSKQNWSIFMPALRENNVTGWYN